MELQKDWCTKYFALSRPRSCVNKHTNPRSILPDSLAGLMSVVVVAVFAFGPGGLCQGEGTNIKTEEELNERISDERPSNMTMSRVERSTDSDTILITYSLIKGAVTAPGAANYLGCFSTDDQWSAETAHLTAAESRDAGFDAKTCIKECWVKRLRLAMIGRGSCLCGGLLTLMTKDEPALCQSPCARNSTELCGGTTALDVYFTGYIPEPAYDVIEYDKIKTVFQGCYEDPKYLVLCNMTFSTRRLTVQMCMEYCSNNFYKYAAVDSPKRCCCTNSLAEALPNKPAKCELLCEDGRGKHESCGGQGGFLAVYVTGATQFEGWIPKIPHYPWMRPNISESIIHTLSEED